MNAAVMKQPEIKVGAGMASQQDWVQCDDTFSMKVLSVDEERHSVEVIFKIKGGYRSGKHKHTCETHVLILEGKVTNHTIGCTFGPGDYCYQAMDDIHDEEFVEDTIAYASYRGYQETLVEFYDDDGKQCGAFNVSDFTAGLKA
jgi:quercetin dioxygenase-like cupin family protein